MTAYEPHCLVCRDTGWIDIRSASHESVRRCWCRDRNPEIAKKRAQGRTVTRQARARRKTAGGEA